MKIPASLALLLPLLACAPAKPVARVFFIAPADGAVVGDTVHFKLGAENLTIVAANGQRVEGEAHHHLFIDVDPTPDTSMIPKNDAIRHLGSGADTVTLVLAPGPHRIIAVAASGDHVPVVGAVRDTLQFVVKAAVIQP